VGDESKKNDLEATVAARILHLEAVMTARILQVEAAAT
jgi:hypothetical protein